MPARKGILTTRHYAILSAVAAFGPCSDGTVARGLNMDDSVVRKTTTGILYRLGLVDWEKDYSYPMPRRKKFSLRITEEGRQVLEKWYNELS